MYESVADESADSTNPNPKPNSAWICHIGLQLKLWPFCDIRAYFGQNLVAVATSLIPLQSEMSSLDWPTTKPPVISNHILAISCRNAILVPKLVVMVMRFCPPIVYGVSQMNSPIAETLSQNQTLYEYDAYNWRWGHFVIFCLFLPKIGCHGNAPLFFAYRRVTDEFLDSTNPIWKQTLHGYVAHNWSYGHFCDFLAYFGQNLVTMATSVRALQSEMSSLDWPTTITPCYK